MHMSSTKSNGSLLKTQFLDASGIQQTCPNVMPPKAHCLVVSTEKQKRESGNQHRISRLESTSSSILGYISHHSLNHSPFKNPWKRSQWEPMAKNPHCLMICLMEQRLKHAASDHFRGIRGWYDFARGPNGLLSEEVTTFVPGKKDAFHAGGHENC